MQKGVIILKKNSIKNVALVSAGVLATGATLATNSTHVRADDINDTQVKQQNNNIVTVDSAAKSLNDAKKTTQQMQQNVDQAAKEVDQAKKDVELSQENVDQAQNIKDQATK